MGLYFGVFSPAIRVAAITFAPTLTLAGGASAQDLEVPIFEYGSDGQAASCFTSVVSGLQANGDGFVAVRSGPGTQYRKIDDIHNGDVVTVYDTKGQWFGVMYGETTGRCNFVGVGKKRRVTYPGKKGWVNRNWLKDFAVSVVRVFGTGGGLK
jgi:Bacterial SH3 domain